MNLVRLTGMTLQEVQNFFAQLGCNEKARGGVVGLGREL